MDQQLPVYVHTIPAPGIFSDFQAELRNIGGTRPDGQPRLVLEWGGDALRYCGSHKVAKYPLMGTMAKRRYGWRIALRWPDMQQAAILGLPAYIDIEDPDHESAMRQAATAYPAAKLGIPISLECLIDFPRPNFYICDWMSPEKMAAGGWRDEWGPFPRDGYYHEVVWIHDPNNVAMMGYRAPDAFDLHMAREYQHVKEHELFNMGRHFDEPVVGGDLAVLNSWIDKSLKHALSEQSKGRTEEIFKGLQQEIRDAKRGPVIAVAGR